MYEPYEGHFDIYPPGGRATLVTPQPAANDVVGLAHRNDKLAMLRRPAGSCRLPRSMMVPAAARQAH